MGTRSLTKIFDHDDLIVCIYRQFDGYPEGHGKELLDFVKRKTVVNGLGLRNENVCNGMGCFAAQLVKALKLEAGNIYLYPPESENVGEEYEYYIKNVDGKIEISYSEVMGSARGPIKKLKDIEPEQTEGDSI